MKLSMVIAGMSVLLVSVAMAFTSLAVIPVVAQESKVTVTVNAPEYVEKGGTFVVTIDVDGVTDLYTAQFDLSFDSSVVKIRDVEEDIKDGKIDGVDVPIYMCTDIDADTVGVLIMLPIEGVSGPGYLAEIEFEIGGDEGETSELSISNGELVNASGKIIPSNWINATITIREEDSDEEPPDITAYEPAEAVVSSTEGASITFEITVDQTVDIGWQINGSEVQTNESVTEAVYTNTSAVIGTWNISVIATNRATDLSIMHTWIWDVTPTPTLEPGVTPTPTLEPGVTPTLTPTLAPGVTPLPTTTPAIKPTPKPTASPSTEGKPTPKPAVPGFEAIFAIAVMTLFLFYKKKTKPLQGFRGRGAEPHKGKKVI